MAGVGALSKAFMGGLCSTRVEGGHIMRAALQRPPGQVCLLCYRLEAPQAPCAADCPRDSASWPLAAVAPRSGMHHARAKGQWRPSQGMTVLSTAARCTTRIRQYPSDEESAFRVQALIT